MFGKRYLQMVNQTQAQGYTADITITTHRKSNSL
jgi:hypothetical protein